MVVEPLGLIWIVFPRISLPNWQRRTLPWFNARVQHDDGARLGPIGVAGNRWGGLPLNNIVRRGKSGVDPSAPHNSALIVHRGQFELEGLPIRIENKMSKEPFLTEFSRKRNHVRIRTPIRLVELDPVPRFVCLSDHLSQTQPFTLVFHIS